MPRVAHWPWWDPKPGPQDYKIRELLRAVFDLHAYYGSKSIWLWRGQADARHNLSPAMHTRILEQGLPLEDASVVQSTEQLLSDARAAGLDKHEGVRLPDMALLALLQHHGAATPLLDVSLDPLVALYMATVSPRGADIRQTGVVFCY